MGRLRIKGDGTIDDGFAFQIGKRYQVLVTMLVFMGFFQLLVDKARIVTPIESTLSLSSLYTSEQSLLRTQQNHHYYNNTNTITDNKNHSEPIPIARSRVNSNSTSQQDRSGATVVQKSVLAIEPDPFDAGNFTDSEDEGRPMSTTSMEPRASTKRSSSSLLDRETCIQKRGSSGYWYRDQEFGRKTFYAFEFRSNKWYRKNKNNSSAVYNGNMYNWRDTSLLSSTTDNELPENSTNAAGDEEQNQTLQDDCQIQAVDRSLFCDTMVKLNIGRIQMVGDSLMGSQMDSLLKLIHFDIGKGWRWNREHTIKHCGDLHNNIQVTFTRENVGANFLADDPQGYLSHGYTTKDREQFGPETPFCFEKQVAGMMGPDDYCPWQLDYNATSRDPSNDSKRTLLVLNQGAHFHSMRTFRNSFDNFVDKFNTIARQDDIVVFRSTVPGHKDCWTEFPVLEMTHDKFLDRFGTNKYDWNLFDEYNQYARDAMATNLTKSVRSLYLNVYNMTVLRPDEHVSATDCLHYVHPGPIDFWNHLLISNLADLATINEAQVEQYQ